MTQRQTCPDCNGTPDPGCARCDGMGWIPCPPACSCPPGWHSTRRAADPDHYELPEERKWDADATDSHDVGCDGCDSVILPGVRHQYNFQTRESFHLGCAASKLWHEERGMPFPPVRGQGDGKALERAAEL